MLFFLVLVFSQVQNDIDRVRFLLEKEMQSVKWDLPDSFYLKEEEPKNPFGWIAKETVAGYFTKIGKHIFLKDSNKKGILSLRVVQLEVEYDGQKLKRGIERRVKGLLYLTFTDSDGLYRWSRKIDLDEIDTLQQKDIEDTKINGLTHEIKRKTGSILKPILLSLSVGALIVALYTVGY